MSAGPDIVAEAVVRRPVDRGECTSARTHPRNANPIVVRPEPDVSIIVGFLFVIPAQSVAPGSAARGFHRHDRPLRRSDRVDQGALPVAAALFHRLSGGDETQRRLKDRLEILPLRSARVAAQACVPAGVASVPPHLGGNGGILLIHGPSESGR